MTEPDEFERQSTALRDRMERRSAELTGAAESMSALTASAEVSGGAVRVTVTAGGTLRDLVLSDAVRGWEPAEIARQVAQCVRQAQSRLAEAAHEAAVGRVGDHPALALVAERMRNAFAEVAPEEPKPEPVLDDFDFDVPVVLDELNRKR